MFYYRRGVCKVGLWAGLARRVGPRKGWTTKGSVSWKHREVPRHSFMHMTQEGIWDRGWIICNEYLSVNFYWDGYHIYFVFICIAHPIYVCVAMIGWFIIREQMFWQVSQETLETGEQDHVMGFWRFKFLMYLCFGTLATFGFYKL